MIGPITDTMLRDANGATIMSIADTADCASATMIGSIAGTMRGAAGTPR